MTSEHNPTQRPDAVASSEEERVTSDLTALDVAMTTGVPLSPVAIALLTPTPEHIDINPPAWLLDLASCIGRGRNAEMDHVLAWLIAEGAATFAADESASDTSWRDDPDRITLPRPRGDSDRHHRNVATPSATLPNVINSLSVASRRSLADTSDLCLAMGVSRWMRDHHCACGTTHKWAKVARPTDN